jgi:hypothetical protein
MHVLLVLLVLLLAAAVAAAAVVVVVFTVVNAAFAAIGVAVLGFYCCCNVWPFSCGVGPYVHHPIID